MTEALKYFLITSSEELLDAPDEGMDYVFMLEKADWSILVSEWNNRESEWQEAITYFAGSVELEIGKEIVFNAIGSSEYEVWTQGLLSLHQSITESIHSESYSFNDEEKELIRSKIYRSEQLTELEELLELLSK